MPIETISGCNGCRKCFEVCPTDVIRMNEETHLAEICYPEDCQCCNLCVVFCPEDAITLTKEKYWPLMTAWG